MHLVAVEVMGAGAIVMRIYKLRCLMVEVGARVVVFTFKQLEDYQICMSLEGHILKGTKASMEKVIKDMAQMAKTSGLVFQ